MAVGDTGNGLQNMGRGEVVVIVLCSRIVVVANFILVVFLKNLSVSNVFDAILQSATDLVMGLGTLILSS